MIRWGSRITLVTITVLSLGTWLGCSSPRPVRQPTAMTGDTYGAGDPLGWQTFGKKKSRSSLPPLAVVEVEP